MNMNTFMQTRLSKSQATLGCAVEIASRAIKETGGVGAKEADDSLNMGLLRTLVLARIQKKLRIAQSVPVAN